MSLGVADEHTGGAPPLPRSIWVVAWASLVGQAVVVAERGPRATNAVSLVASCLLGALLVGYVSAGVVRARTVRLVLAFLVLTLTAIFGVLALISVDGVLAAAVVVASLATTVVALGGLVRFRESDWYRWQRTKPPVSRGASIRSLVAVGVVVGVMGGLVGPADDGARVRVDVAGRTR